MRTSTSPVAYADYENTEHPMKKLTLTHIAGDVATGAAIAAAHVPYVPGEIPCYTVEGVPYYTPPGDPC
jgi:hypothetical protein